jgi:hypothetical protein
MRAWLSASLLISAALAHTSAATTCAYSQAPATSIGISQINFVIANGPTSALDNALGIWSYGCIGEGSSYPSLSSSGTSVQGAGVVNVTVLFPAGASSNGKCGTSTLYYDPQTGTLTGGVIYLYEYQVINGVQTQCNSATNYDAVIAHEIGQSLGLGDLYTVQPGSCSGALMSDDPEEVYPDECAVAEQNFYTPAEDAGSHPPNDGGSGPDGLCPGGPGTCTSPIVINLDGGRYELTGLDDSVAFDINADGRPDRLGWTAAGTREGFLALDRNGNGRIDDGSELFGNYTRLRNGERAPNGFVALAEFDDNFDGVIDANDSAWHSLLLWIDENHDGISDPGELYSLNAVGITSLRFNAHWTGRRDDHGNMFRYQSIYTLGRATKPYYDIYFATSKPAP